ncbi:MAG TPA: family 1 glycosylhydrolase [Gemmatimonadaceae bacterium]|nr:family 1 glycosylhydrolase [Gemmatimonadaceae bacterium]
MHGFMFATGIEGSYPSVVLPDGRRHRVDEFEACGHYARWREDFELVRELGVTHLRYGPPYYRTHLAPGCYDWSFADETLDALRRMGITPIADLCHFGVPDWLGDFQNPDFPRHFAEYARAFAERYSWITFYTPINEIYITARFSALLGWWNERLTSDRSFVAALKHLCQANLLAMRAILSADDTAVFVQSESSEYYHPMAPGCIPQARLLNYHRFLALDLSYGRPISAAMYRYLLEHGMTPAEYDWFAENQVAAHCVMGTDYYLTNEHLVRPDGTTEPAGDVFGYYVIARQYFDRYKLPMMHTETNCAEPASLDWLRKQWANVVRLMQDGVPVVGFTWYSLTDQVDWDTTLREANGHVNALGLYDLDRRIRPVGEAYRRLIAEWQDIVHTGLPLLSWAQ